MIELYRVETIFQDLALSRAPPRRSNVVNFEMSDEDALADDKIKRGVLMVEGELLCARQSDSF